MGIPTDSRGFPDSRDINRYSPWGIHPRRPKNSSPEFTAHGPILLADKAHGLHRQGAKYAKDGHGGNRGNGTAAGDGYGQG